MSLYRSLVVGMVAAGVATGIAGCVNSESSHLERSSADAGRDHHTEFDAKFAALKKEGYKTCDTLFYDPDSGECFNLGEARRLQDAHVAPEVANRLVALFTGNSLIYVCLKVPADGL